MTPFHMSLTPSSPSAHDAQGTLLGSLLDELLRVSMTHEERNGMKLVVFSERDFAFIRHSLLHRAAKIERALSFAKSMILSGEKMSDSARQIFDECLSPHQ